MGTVNKILQEKGTNTYYINPTHTVYQALEELVGKNVSALLVIDEGELVGIFSEKDYARKVILKGKSSKETTVGEIMTSDLITVTPETTISECMEIMTTNFIRHLPVISCAELVGIISIGDVVKYIIGEQQFIIENMEQYITGR